MTVSLSTVDAILRAEDIEGLLAFGAPSNEYSDEAAAIQSALERLSENQLTEAQVSALIMGVWNHSFGPFSVEDIQRRQPVLQHLAHSMLNERLSGGTSESSESAAGFSTGAGGR